VELLQTMLLALGFDPGDADGVYGAQLKAAVYNFQLYEGIPANGIAGEQTAAAITQRWQAAQRHEAVAEQPLAGCVIGIDAGHQRHANPEQEPISPGSDITKDKVSSGTEGQFTGIPEYVVNLQVALKLKAALEALGAQVVMTRQTHDVNISNSRRARMMNEAGVDCWLRIHANYTRNPSIHGMFILVPPEGGLDTSDPTAAEKSAALAQTLLECAMETTGADGSRGLEVRDDQTGFGWSQVPVCNIEMGYMSNEAEDRLLVTEAYQQKIVYGLTEGFIEYFTEG
jgi:N-acetylmuramoyl-L-alanine amidase